MQFQIFDSTLCHILGVWPMYTYKGLLKSQQNIEQKRSFSENETKFLRDWLSAYFMLKIYIKTEVSRALLT